MNQRNKGANAEREIANILKDHGIDARRGLVFLGEPDVVGLPGYHLEIKRQETYRIDDWLKQSEEDANENEIPLVIFRKSRQPWRVIIDLEEFLKLL